LSSKFLAGDIVELSTQGKTILAFALCTDAGKLSRLSFLPVKAEIAPAHDYDRVLVGRYTVDCSKPIHLSDSTVAKADIHVVAPSIQHLPDVLKTVALFHYDTQALDNWTQGREVQESSKGSFGAVRQAFSSAQRLFQREPDEKNETFFLETKKMLHALDKER
jgi:hypothetical protein